ncbi:hypothetical protein PG985_004432 [Apiospora marii]|uniref:Uncharacterized protein n=1 Tax=Apiospora marii TaxID=335849 RepID=A0ABR1S9A0_9PEZI
MNPRAGSKPTAEPWEARGIFPVWVEQDELGMSNKLLSAPAKESKTCCPIDVAVPSSSRQVEMVAQCTHFVALAFVDDLGMGPPPALGVGNESFAEAEPPNGQPTPVTSSKDSKHKSPLEHFTGDAGGARVTSKSPVPTSKLICVNGWHILRGMPGDLFDSS